MTVAGLETKQETDHDIYQTSTMLALLDGLYDGVVAFEELQKHGDFGLGTFDQLNGEMIAFDGEFYHLLPDGTAHRVKPEETTPFSTVTFFREDFTYTVDHPMHREELEALLLKLFPSRNLFYAFRMDGTFREVKTRTVPHQVKPYKPFIEATKSQPTFTFNETSGVVTGFWTPAYAQGIGVAGFHLHFINDERTGGGHVFDFVVDKCTIRICQKSNLHLVLPDTPDYLTANLSRENLEKEIAVTEGAQ